MSYYDNPAWSSHNRQQSWDPAQAAPRSGSGPGSAAQRDDLAAFGSQYEEIAKASENLLKGGKGFGAPGAGRRDSLPSGGNFARQFPDFEPRLPGSQRPVSEYDGGRAQTSGTLQGYIANQRYGPRQTEAEQMQQAKRRMAAQRERELRNYHQEQQYNRHLSGAKSDRSLSPSAMNEEDRRELIARQHRALYGDNSNLYLGDGSNPRPVSQDARVAAGLLGPTNPAPGFESYGIGAVGSSEPTRESAQAGQTKDQSSSGLQEPVRPSSSSPSNNTNFGAFDSQSQQQQGRTSTSSPRGSPPLQGSKGASSSSVAPIGTRPAQQNAGGSQPKRNTPPMNSSLGFNNNNNNGNNSNSNSNATERSSSAQSNPAVSAAEKTVGLGWGTSSGVWGSGKAGMGVQASVWG